MVGVTLCPIHQHAHQPLPTHKVHTVFSQPMETLEEEKESKERHEARTEVIPKNSEGQTSLSDSVPGPLQKVLWVEQGMIWNPAIVCPALDPVPLGPPIYYLHLCCSELPKEHLAHHFAQEEDKDKGLDVQDLGVGKSHS